MAATMGGDVDADLTALESRVKGLRNRLRAMLLSETASLQARSCFDTEHSSSSNSFAHPDLSYSDDASDDKPPPYPSVAPSLDSQPHSRPVLTPIPPESPVTPLCAHTPDRETAPVGPRPPLSTSAAPPPPPPPPPPMSPYRAHPPPPPPTPPLVNLSARSQPAEPGVAQSRIESKLDALYMALTSALSNMQSTQPSLADVHIPEYTPLSKEPPPEHMADIVDAREALLAELKEKLAARRGDE